MRQSYSPTEIARAAGVTPDEVWQALTAARLVEPDQSLSRSQRTGPFLAHDRAVSVGRALIDARRRRPVAGREALFASSGHLAATTPSFSLALSGSIHGLILVIAALLTTFGFSSSAQTIVEEPHEKAHLIFIASPGPGGGGGGGGRRERIPPPQAKRQGDRHLSSPIPARRTPPAEQPAKPPEPEPKPAEPLPPVVAPVVTAAADPVDRPGTLDPVKTQADSHGSGTGGGVGTGTGTGLGEGDGRGIGPGSGGGTGGGPYRPGSGIEPPRLVREVKPDYTDEARRRGIVGEVVLEIVVKRDGSVGDVRVVDGLGGGLNERAIAAVKQWRFEPAKRLGTPVDVLVEVSVEFRQR